MSKGHFMLLRERVKKVIKNGGKVQKSTVSSKIQLQNNTALRTPIQPSLHPRQTITYDRKNSPIRQF